MSKDPTKPTAWCYEKKIPDNIQELLDYSIVSGRFYWKVKPAVCVSIGDRAGAVTRKDRYVQIQISGCQYAAHRIAWRVVCGEDSTGPIDHINHDESCNGFHNLRVVTHLENSRHRRIIANTGHTNLKRNGNNVGVRIGHKWIGTYPTVEDAIAARDAARIAMGL